MSSMSNNSTTGVPRAAFLAARKAWPERGHDDRLRTRSGKYTPCGPGPASIRCVAIGRRGGPLGGPL